MRLLGAQVRLQDIVGLDLDTIFDAYLVFKLGCHSCTMPWAARTAEKGPIFSWKGEEPFGEWVTRGPAPPVLEKLRAFLFVGAAGEQQQAAIQCPEIRVCGQQASPSAGSLDAASPEGTSPQRVAPRSPRRSPSPGADSGSESRGSRRSRSSGTSRSRSSGGSRGNRRSRSSRGGSRHGSRAGSHGGSRAGSCGGSRSSRRSRGSSRPSASSRGSSRLGSPKAETPSPVRPRSGSHPSQASPPVAPQDPEDALPSKAEPARGGAAIGCFEVPLKGLQESGKPVTLRVERFVGYGGSARGAAESRTSSSLSVRLSWKRQEEQARHTDEITASARALADGTDELCALMSQLMGQPQVLPHVSQASQESSQQAPPPAAPSGEAPVTGAAELSPSMASSPKVAGSTIGSAAASRGDSAGSQRPRPRSGGSASCASSAGGRSASRAGAAGAAPPVWRPPVRDILRDRQTTVQATRPPARR